MKKSDVEFKNRPFENLESLLRAKGASLPSREPSSGKSFFESALPAPKTSPGINDQDLFNEWMKDVTPLDRKWTIQESGPKTGRFRHPDEGPDSGVSRLDALVNGGGGFVVSQTAEYVEGAGYGVGIEVARRLHQGHYSLQDYIDLHGLDSIQAEEAFNDFLSRSVASGKRAVLVVHGRGLSSPGDPVLKTKVLFWLTKTRWRKWVLAFSSARACDGGSGATAVLLRGRPAGRRDRKRPPQSPGKGLV